jgi:hypothetical protein
MRTTIALFAFCCLTSASPASEPLRFKDLPPALEGTAPPSQAAEIIRAHLQSLKPDPALQKKVAEWIAQLGDASFTVRATATRGLLELPIVPLQELRTAAESADSETSIRAKQILNHPKTAEKIELARRARRRTVELLHSIERHEVVGTASVLLESAPWFQDDELVGLAADAIAKAVRPDDLPAIRAALAEDSIASRIVAIRGLGKAGGSAALADLRTLAASEKTPRLRLAIANAFAEQGDPSCLAMLIEFLASEDVRIRTRAEQILRAATGKNFGFNPFVNREEQDKPIASWKAWLTEHGVTAKLQVPLVIKPLPEDLSNGLIAHYSFEVDGDGRLADKSGRGRNAQTANAVAYVVRGKGHALEFMGEGHHGANGGHAILPWIDFAKLDQFTLAMWVHETNLTHEEGEAYITYGIDRGVSTEDALGIAHFNGSLIFRAGDGQIALPYNAVDRGRWVHLAMTVDAGRLRAYRDADAVGEVKTRVHVKATLAALGRHWWQEGAGTSTRLRGAMDEVRVYDRALSGEQIRLLMEQTNE